jgi:hypothetical protein
MKLIDESKIAYGSNEAYLKLKHNAYFGNGFQSGVYFAENELQNLAIEFSDWKDSNCIKQWSSRHGAFWSVNGKTAMYFHNRELFIIFMEQRTKLQTKGCPI